MSVLPDFGYPFPPLNLMILLKCQRGDSNPYGFLHQILSLARLPIPPPWHSNSGKKRSAQFTPERLSRNRRVPDEKQSRLSLLVYESQLKPTQTTVGRHPIHGNQKVTVVMKRATRFAAILQA